MKTRKVILLSSALFLSMGLQAKRESANYSIGPETFAPLAGDANSSNYAQFSAVEPLSGLSVKDLPDFKNFTGFIGQLPALDQDGDGISDINEVALGTDKTDPDTDGDGLTDGEEVALGTDPLSTDSDGDGYSDFAEVDANTNPSVAGSNPNRAPTLIELNGSTVLENQPLETLVGHFSATDPDANQSLTLSIVQGVGNASLFFLDGNNGLRTASIFDYEASPNTLILSVRATDDYNASIYQSFVIEVANIVEDLDGDGIEDADDMDRDGDGFSDADELAYGSDPSDENSVANQAPVSISLSSNSILENQPPGSLIGIISVSDPDQNDIFQVSIVPPSDANGIQPPFLVEANGNLKAGASFDFETRSNYPLRLRASDQHGASIESDFVIQVLDYNETVPSPPVDSNGTTPPPPTDNNQSTIIDHNDTHQPDPGPIDQNQSTEEPVVEQNETDPTDHNQSIMDGLKEDLTKMNLWNGMKTNKHFLIPPTHMPKSTERQPTSSSAKKVEAKLRLI